MKKISIFIFLFSGLISASLMAQDKVVLGGYTINPAASIFENLSHSGAHTVFTAGIRAAALEKLLSGKGEFTLIAPVSDPIIHEIPYGRAEQLFNELLPEQQPEMYAIIAYHILPGIYTTKTLADAIRAARASGPPNGALRAHYEAHFTRAAHLAALARALREI